MLMISLEHRRKLQFLRLVPVINNKSNSFTEARLGIGSVGSVETGVGAKVGVQVGAVNSVDLGIFGAEIGKNGFRLSLPFGSIRLFGN